ncbi:MAG: copper chaperone PCu(A)C [Hyphomicrobiaceae bacterium]|nr:copper chaperone PCu(A)C [Hyphomicrobiaceae bacterium]
MRRSMVHHLATTTLLSLVVLAAPAVAKDVKSKDGAVTVSTPWARATPGGAKIGAAFLEISSGAGGDAVVSASSPVAGKVELHTHANDGGVMRMRQIEAIDVPASGKVTLKPGGLHIMLMDLKQPLKEGEAIDLTLSFRKAGEVKVQVPVLKVGSPGPDGSKGGHGKH